MSRWCTDLHCLPLVDGKTTGRVRWWQRFPGWWGWRPAEPPTPAAGTSWPSWGEWSSGRTHCDGSPSQRGSQTGLHTWTKKKPKLSITFKKSIEHFIGCLLRYLRKTTQNAATIGSAEDTVCWNGGRFSSEVIFTLNLLVYRTVQSLPLRHIFLCGAKHTPTSWHHHIATAAP